MNICFLAKVWLQIEHIKGFFFKWTASMWHFRSFLAPNPVPHVGHKWGFFPSCTVSICRFTRCFSENLDSHKWQANGFNPWWIASMWRFKSLFLASLAPQMVHNFSVNSLCFYVSRLHIFHKNSLIWTDYHQSITTNRIDWKRRFSNAGIIPKIYN